MKRLTELNKGNRGEILSFENKELQLALLQHGLIAGDHFTLSDLAPFGGPLALEIQGHKIALRKEDAHQIIVKRLP